MHFRWIITLAMVVMSGCNQTQSQQISPTDSVDEGTASRLPIDPMLGEIAYPKEEALAQEIAAVIEAAIRKRDSTGTARRDVHPKAHGCVKASFSVSEALPAKFASGVFVPGKRYDAWIRFSNGSSTVDRADIKGDARGMAIKLMDVPGPTLVGDPLGETTQDFILISHPVFFMNDPKAYLSLMKRVNNENFFSKLLVPFTLGFKGTLIGREITSKKISNPLQTRYWSEVPYQLGSGPERKAVKYSARACTTMTDPFPKNPSDNFLREALRHTLENTAACMEFLIQPRTSDALSVEDSMTEWEEDDAPFFPVATIEIPVQDFDTAEQNTFCENLSFNPWHALPDHKPLGVMNRLRKSIYEHTTRVRHSMNAVETKLRAPGIQ